VTAGRLGHVGTTAQRPRLISVKSHCRVAGYARIMPASSLVSICFLPARPRSAMLAHQIMTRNVLTVSPETPVIEAARTMLRHHVGGLPVVDADGKLVGMVTDGDFVRRAEIGTDRRRGRWLGRLLGRDRIAADFVRAHGRKVGDIMTLDPVTVAEDTPLEQVVQMMESSSVKRLPVLNGDRLVGMITYADFVQTIAGLAQDVPGPSVDDDRLRDQIMAAIDKAALRPCRFTVVVRDGVVHLNGAVKDDKMRQAARVAAECVPGVKNVRDHLWIYPPPEEDLGGGDFVSLQEETSTEDDQPL
jgi:CBS domain-containing protein